MCIFRHFTHDNIFHHEYDSIMLCTRNEKAKETRLPEGWGERQSWGSEGDEDAARLPLRAVPGDGVLHRAGAPRHALAAAPAAAVLPDGQSVAALDALGALLGAEAGLARELAVRAVPGQQADAARTAARLLGGELGHLLVGRRRRGVSLGSRGRQRAGEHQQQQHPAAGRGGHRGGGGGRRRQRRSVGTYLLHMTKFYINTANSRHLSCRNSISSISREK